MEEKEGGGSDRLVARHVLDVSVASTLRVGLKGTSCRLRRGRYGGMTKLRGPPCVLAKLRAVALCFIRSSAGSIFCFYLSASNPRLFSLYFFFVSRV